MSINLPTMKLNQDTIIADLAAYDYRTAQVLEHYGINFCCRGHRTINEVCESKNIIIDTLIRELNKALESKGTVEDFKSWPLGLLAEYIETKHHRYARARIGLLTGLLSKICRKQADLQPELYEILEIFTLTAKDFIRHMEHEELIIFPYIKTMSLYKGNLSGKVLTEFKKVGKDILQMQEEHDYQLQGLLDIRELTNNFIPGASATFGSRKCLRLLKDFEQDLHLHLHLENNILYPKVMDMNPL
jgi:regulator of cell morphogenesis and NO signaling